MRIGYKVFLVGAIPISIAAAIALTAWVLLAQAEQARNGAVLAGAVYRDLIETLTARDDYVKAPPRERAEHVALFTTMSARAHANLRSLGDVADNDEQTAATRHTADALGRYSDRMRAFVDVTIGNDRRIADMSSRAALLILLTDQARQRQHASNADIIVSLTASDRKLRFARDIVDRAQELRAAIAAVERHEAVFKSATSPEAVADTRRQFGFATVRLANAVNDLSEVLKADNRIAEANDLDALHSPYRTALGMLQAGEALPLVTAETLSQPMAAWTDRLVKIYSTEQRALHEEVAQLLTYSVQAGETEQATQNIAITTLKLGQQTAEALVNRNPSAARDIIEQSRMLSETVSSLPISPLIQTEMIDAIDRWREALDTTTEGLETQNGMIADMDATAFSMIEGARALNDMFTSHAAAIGGIVRTILVVGAAIGLLLGAATAFIVARSITGPLRKLQHGMLELAQNPLAGSIRDSTRRDELGDMARAANTFVTEIGNRERALRLSKDRADAALEELQRTQAELIRAEKLASLGQLVAGVAHEINTPVGIALTTATLLGDEVRRIDEAASSGRLAKADFRRLVERMTEGSRLLFTNLTRAADLVHSFKQVAADQASGERRQFNVEGWLHELLVSLGPALRKTTHEVTVKCPAEAVIDTYPGALAQVLTNLVMNAVAHAYDEGQSGHLTLAVDQRPDGLRFTFTDDGKGIACTEQGRVFEPFYTTRRSRGSTGLGLHIVYNLVTGVLQGRIDIESMPGTGTSFIIDLPPAVTDATAERQAVSA